ncbi:hypothetical protein [Crossiella sp. CA198]|uniref:hypothetical protein n=1 Tax=Crossiella sp. CA198 TaxID=3455607 RepID=UPI003F8D403B
MPGDHLSLARTVDGVVVVIKETAQPGAAEMTLRGAEIGEAAGFLHGLAEGADGEREFGALSVARGVEADTVLFSATSGTSRSPVNSVILANAAAGEIAAALWTAAADAELGGLDTSTSSAPVAVPPELVAEMAPRVLAVASAYTALGQQRADVVAAARFIHTGR